jgi:hypothetical protein
MKMKMLLQATMAAIILQASDGIAKNMLCQHQ